MSTKTFSLRTGLRLASAAMAVTVLGLGALAQFSSGGLTAQILNDTNTASSGTLLYSHSYTGSTCSSLPTSGGIPATTSFSCPGSIAPTTPTTTTGSISATDAIAYRGSTPAAQITQQVSAPSCAPVQLANSLTASDPMLVRYGTTFAPATGPRPGMGAITLDGASPGGYAADVVQSSLAIPTAPFLGSATATYGYGIWFNAASGSAGGPLFGFGDSAANAVGSNDRILYLTTAGKLAFVGNTGGSTLTQTTATDYRGDWHFAYVTLTVTSRFLVAGSVGASIYVDGSATPIASGTLTGAATSYNGYWHVGWSPIGGASKYFAGSLSNLVVDNSSPAMTPPASTDLAGQTAFDSWSAGTSSRYRFNDTGTTTYTGALPGGAANPCTTVNLNWGFANPVSCGYSPNSSTAACTNPPAASLAGFANGTPRTIAAPAPGTTQTSTITVTRGTGYSTTFAPGLHLYAPLSFTATRGGWVNTFTWSDATSVFIA